jgi:phosphoribosylaminoimidazole carboxylase (NCAIR synthetase)
MFIQIFNKIEKDLGYILTDILPILKYRGSFSHLVGPKNYEGSYELQNLNKLMMIDNLHIHHYGKYKSKPDRKLGHITLLLDNYPPSEDYVNDIKKLAIITPCD